MIRINEAHLEQVFGEIEKALQRFVNCEASTSSHILYLHKHEDLQLCRLSRDIDVHTFHCFTKLDPEDGDSYSLCDECARFWTEHTDANTRQTAMRCRLNLERFEPSVICN